MRHATAMVYGSFVAALRGEIRAERGGHEEQRDTRQSTAFRQN